MNHPRPSVKRQPEISGLHLRAAKLPIHRKRPLARHTKSSNGTSERAHNRRRGGGITEQLRADERIALPTCRQHKSIACIKRRLRLQKAQILPLLHNAAVRQHLTPPRRIFRRTDLADSACRRAGITSQLADAAAQPVAGVLVKTEQRLAARHQNHARIAQCLQMQVRIGKQGIYSPGQGVFPRLTSGFYYDDRLLVSRGVTNATWAPRINCSCEVIILHLEPKG